MDKNIEKKLMEPDRQKFLYELNLADISIAVFAEPPHYDSFIQYVVTHRPTGVSATDYYGGLDGSILALIRKLTNTETIHDPNCELCHGSGLVATTNSYDQPTVMNCPRSLTDRILVKNGGKRNG